MLHHGVIFGIVDENFVALVICISQFEDAIGQALGFDLRFGRHLAEFWCTHGASLEMPPDVERQPPRSLGQTIPRIDELDHDPRAWEVHVGPVDWDREPRYPTDDVDLHVLVVNCQRVIDPRT